MLSCQSINIALNNLRYQLYEIPSFDSDIFIKGSKHYAPGGSYSFFTGKILPN